MHFSPYKTSHAYIRVTDILLSQPHLSNNPPTKKCRSDFSNRHFTFPILIPHIHIILQATRTHCKVHITSRLLPCHFTFRRSQIKFIQLQFYFDIIISLLSGGKNNRLNIPCISNKNANPLVYAKHWIHQYCNNLLSELHTPHSKLFVFLHFHILQFFHSGIYSLRQDLYAFFIYKI